MNNILNGPGFLGTNAPLLSDLSLILILITAILFTIGWQLARTKKFEAHRWIQTITACLNALVVLIVMIRAFIIHIIPGIPSKLLQGDYAVTTIHAVIGIVGLLLGAYSVIQGNELSPKILQIKRYKRVMRVTYIAYMLATLLGVGVYVLVYLLGV